MVKGYERNNVPTAGYRTLPHAGITTSHSPQSSHCPDHPRRPVHRAAGSAIYRSSWPDSASWSIV